MTQRDERNPDDALSRISHMATVGEGLNMKASEAVGFLSFVLARSLVRLRATGEDFTHAEWLDLVSQAAAAAQDDDEIGEKFFE